MQQLDEMNLKYVRLVQESTNLIKLCFQMNPIISKIFSKDEKSNWFSISRNLEQKERDTTSLYEDTVQKYLQMGVNPKKGDAIHDKLLSQNPYLERLEVKSLLDELIQGL